MRDVAFNTSSGMSSSSFTIVDDVRQSTSDWSDTSALIEKEIAFKTSGKPVLVASGSTAELSILVRERSEPSLSSLSFLVSSVFCLIFWSVSLIILSARVVLTFLLHPRFAFQAYMPDRICNLTEQQPSAAQFY